MKNIIAYQRKSCTGILKRRMNFFSYPGWRIWSCTRNSLGGCEKGNGGAYGSPVQRHGPYAVWGYFQSKKYTIQRHDERQLLTTVGPVRFTHTLFRSRKDGTCHYLLDEWMETGCPWKTGAAVEAEVLAEAVKTSYASAARALGEDSVISKTAVMDKVHGSRQNCPFRSRRRKSVEYLYIEADEDQVIQGTSRRKTERTESIEKEFRYWISSTWWNISTRQPTRCWMRQGEAKGRLWKALYKGKKKKVCKDHKSYPEMCTKRKRSEWLWGSICWTTGTVQWKRRMQDKNVYGCSAEDMGHMYSDRS